MMTYAIKGAYKDSTLRTKLNRLFGKHSILTIKAIPLNPILSLLFCQNRSMFIEICDIAYFIPAASRFSASFTSRTTRLMLWPNLLKFLDAPIAPAAN